MSAGRTCTTRTRNTISRAPEIEPNKFAVPVHAAILRRTGCLNTNASPAKSSLRSPANPVASDPAPAAAGLITGSLALISSKVTVETPYEIASVAIAPDFSRPNKAPPSPGPATWEKA
ncbi:MAG TPA: hypothetical protein VF940_15385 [Streptosporangiaceae bacterium]